MRRMSQFPIAPVWLVIQQRRREKQLQRHFIPATSIGVSGIRLGRVDPMRIAFEGRETCNGLTPVQSVVPTSRAGKGGCVLLLLR